MIPYRPFVVYLYLVSMVITTRCSPVAGPPEAGCGTGSGSAIVTTPNGYISSTNPRDTLVAHRNTRLISQLHLCR